MESIRAVGGGATVFRGFTPYINLFSVHDNEIKLLEKGAPG